MSKSRAIFVTGTDTNVGKTYISGRILEELAKRDPGLKLAFYKPIQCGLNTTFESREITSTDYDYMRKKDANIDVFYSYFFNYPAAPYLSARLENIEIDLEKIKSDFKKIREKHDFVLVEGAGGISVPIMKNVLMSDLARELDIPVLIVARPDLGTINHSLLTIEHARKEGLDIYALFVNNYSQVKHYSWDDHDLPAQMKDAPDIIRTFSKARVETEVSILVDGILEAYGLERV